MKTILLLGFALFFASCHRPPAAAPSAEQSSIPASNAVSAASDATISASPNPLKGGPEEGTVTVTWDTKGDEAADVYVSHNGAAEQLFAKGKSGSKTVNWIRQGSTYEFSLYEDASHKLLGKVQVTHQRR